MIQVGRYQDGNTSITGCFLGQLFIAELVRKFNVAPFDLDSRAAMKTRKLLVKQAYNKPRTIESGP